MRSRRAFTLVEMLVVIALIVLIATITALVLPNILRNNKSTQGANLLQGMLLAAKQRALRDRVASGVRLNVVTDPVYTNATNTRLVSYEMVYIIRPDDFVVAGTDQLTIGADAFGNPIATSQTVDFAGGLSTLIPAVPEQYPVQPGDYLELNGGGLVTAINAQIYQSTPPPSFNGFNVIPLASNPSTGQPVKSYRIIRGPRPVVGEDSVKMPKDVAVLLSDVGGTATYYSQNVPQRAIPFGTTFYFYEILFSPSGSVIGQGTAGSDKVVLFVADLTRDTPTTDGEPALVVVNIRTGAIGVQPVDVSSGNPYSFTQDPRSSGM